jgi:hypothetical protein
MNSLCSSKVGEGESLLSGGHSWRGTSPPPECGALRKPSGRTPNQSQDVLHRLLPHSRCCLGPLHPTPAHRCREAGHADVCDVARRLQLPGPSRRPLPHHIASEGPGKVRHLHRLCRSHGCRGRRMQAGTNCARVYKPPCMAPAHGPGTYVMFSLPTMFLLYPNSFSQAQAERASHASSPLAAEPRRPQLPAFWARM